MKGCNPYWKRLLPGSEQAFVSQPAWTIVGGNRLKPFIARNYSLFALNVVSKTLFAARRVIAQSLNLVTILKLYI